MERPLHPDRKAASQSYLAAIQEDADFQEARQKYMPLWLLPVSPRPTPGSEEEPSRRMALTPDHALERYRALVLLGDAGSGKTLLLRRMALEQAEASLAQEDPPTSETTRYLPFYIDLAAYRGGSVAALLVEILQRYGLPQADPAILETLAREYTLLLLFDGLGDISPAHQVEGLAAITSFLSKLGAGHRYVVCCRTGEFPLFQPWFTRASAFQLRELDSAFTRRYLGRFLPEDLTRFLHEDADWHDLMRNPRTLDLLAQAAQAYRKAGRFLAKGALLLDLTRQLITIPPASAAIPDAEQFLPLLARWARTLFEAGTDTFSREEALPPLARAISSLGKQGGAAVIHPTQFLRHLLRCGLLVLQRGGEALSFPKTAVRDALAAWDLEGQATVPPTLALGQEETRRRWAPLVPLWYAITADRTGFATRLVQQEEAGVALLARCLVQGEAPPTWGSLLSKYLGGEPRLHYRAGLALEELGYLDQAAAQLEEALALGMEQPEVAFRLGQIYERRDDLPRARQEYLRASSLDPSTSLYRRHLGVVCGKMGEYDEAVTRLKEVVREHMAACARASFDLGQVYQLQARFGAALEELRRAAELMPHVVEYHCSLGMVYGLVGDNGRAETELLAALRLSPHDPWAHNELGVVYERQGRDEEALGQYIRASDLVPQEALYHRNAAATYFRLGRNQEALGELQAAVELDPNYADAYHVIGQVYEALGQQEEALQQFRRAIELEPERAVYHRHIGVAFRRLGRLEEAVRSLRQAVELQPEEASGHGELAEAYWQQGRHEGALEEYRWALELAPGEAVYHRDLGAALRRLGQLEEAEKHLSFARRPPQPR